MYTLALMFATCLKIERYPLLSSYLLRATGDGVCASHAALSGDHRADDAGRCFEVGKVCIIDLARSKFLLPLEQYTSDAIVAG